jgi:hypothetical protein
VISGFRREENDICALLGYYAAINDNSLSTFRDSLSGQIFKDQEMREEFLLGFLELPLLAV